MRRLLLVDDSATFRRIVSNMLKERFLIVDREGRRRGRKASP